MKSQKKSLSVTPPVDSTIVKPVGRLSSEEGFISLDFIFSTILFGAFVSIFVGFAILFSVVEVVQYATFSSARSFSLSHRDNQAQRQLGEEKFVQITSSNTLRSVLQNGWFEVDAVQLGDFNPEMATDKDRSSDAETFVGARVNFSAPILFKRYPLMGQTGEDRDSFFARVQSFTGREPTQEECRQFGNQRIQAIQSRYSVTDPNAYHNLTDNGC